MRRLLDDGEGTLSNNLINFKISIQIKYRILLFFFEYLYQLDKLVASPVLIWNFLNLFTLLWSRLFLLKALLRTRIGDDTL